MAGPRGLFAAVRCGRDQGGAALCHYSDIAVWCGQLASLQGILHERSD